MCVTYLLPEIIPAGLALWSQSPKFLSAIEPEQFLTPGKYSQINEDDSSLTKTGGVRKSVHGETQYDVPERSEPNRDLRFA